jgi:hypothetical protein
LSEIQTVKLVKDGDCAVVNAGSDEEKAWRAQGYVAEGEEVAKPMTATSRRTSRAARSQSEDGDDE